MLCEALRELLKDEIEMGIEKGVKERIEEQIEERIEERAKERIEERVKEQLDEVETRAEANGLKALVDVLKGLSLDFNSAYQAIIQTETYAKVTKKQVMAHWKQIN